MEFLDLIIAYDHKINDPDVFYIHNGYYDYLNSMMNSIGKNYVNKKTEKNFTLFLEYLYYLCNLSKLNSHMYFRYKDNYLEYLLTDTKQSNDETVVLILNVINNIKCDRFIKNLMDSEFLSLNPDMVYKTQPIKLLYHERD